MYTNNKSVTFVRRIPTLRGISGMKGSGETRLWREKKIKFKVLFSHPPLLSSGL